MGADGVTGAGAEMFQVFLHLAVAAAAFLLGGITVAFFRIRTLSRDRSGSADGSAGATRRELSAEAAASAAAETAPDDRRALAFAHEFKNYLCVIKGNARLLRTGARGGEQADILNRIDRALEMLERFAWKGRSEVPDPIEPRTRVAMDVAKAARACARLHFAGTGASFPCEVGGAEPIVLGDPLRLDQVFRNLYGNALEAGARTVSARFRRIGMELEITLEDDGRGCGPESVERLFHPFFTTKPGSRGLGLYIVRSIVESHGGRIRALAKNGRPGGGRGLVFYIHFPLASRIPVPAGPSPSLPFRRGPSRLRSAA